MKPADATTPPVPWIDELVALLERQQAAVGRLLALARSQGALIEKGRSEPLLGLLAQRQRLIDEFTAVQGELSTRTGDLTRRLQSVAAGDRDRIRGLIDDISARLGEIMQLDEKDQHALAAARERARTELAAHGAARQARSAYAGRPYAPSRFADRQG